MSKELVLSSHTIQVFLVLPFRSCVILGVSLNFSVPLFPEDNKNTHLKELLGGWNKFCKVLRQYWPKLSCTLKSLWCHRPTWNPFFQLKKATLRGGWIPNLTATHLSFCLLASSTQITCFPHSPPSSMLSSVAPHWLQHTAGASKWSLFQCESRYKFSQKPPGGDWPSHCPLHATQRTPFPQSFPVTPNSHHQSLLRISVSPSL